MEGLLSRGRVVSKPSYDAEDVMGALLTILTIVIIVTIAPVAQA